MGQVRLVGADAAAALESLIPVDVIDLPAGMHSYGLLLKDDGGIIEDLMFFNRDDSNGGDLFVVIIPSGACFVLDLPVASTASSEVTLPTPNGISADLSPGGEVEK